jgi:hypothetical protein
LTERLLSLSRRQPTDRRVIDLSNVIAELRPVLVRVLEGAIAVTITPYRTSIVLWCLEAQDRRLSA